MTRLPDRPTLTVAEVAELLDVTEDALYRAVQRGEIPAIRIGRIWRIPTARLADMLGMTAPASAELAATR